MCHHPLPIGVCHDLNGLDNKHCQFRDSSGSRGWRQPTLSVRPTCASRCVADLEPVMSRRGDDARTRARRHRAAVALRSQTARAADDPSPADTAGLGLRLRGCAAAGSRSISPRELETQPARAPSAARRPRRRQANFDPARLYDLVAAREAAAAAVDTEVRRLRRLGASWPQLAAALGVSRQAARQRYGP